MQKISLVAVLAAALTACVARGSTIEYSVSGASTSAGSLTGTVNVHSATGVLSSASLELNDPALSSPGFNRVGSAAAYNGMSQAWISGASSGASNYGGQVALFFDTDNLQGGGPLSLCTSAAACGRQGVEASYVEVYSNRGTVNYDLISGTLARENLSASASAQPAQTAEPSTLILLGSGMIAGMMVWRRKRFPSPLPR